MNSPEVRVLAGASVEVEVGTRMVAECWAASWSTMATAWLVGGARRASLCTVREMAASAATFGLLRFSVNVRSHS